ncbi:unnamed protein product [Dimorphilus gyrociliatus]|uniref:Riboflavin transporter n=1 Tax=Dimorphilus gyrociliatus TaxID=2664684 RepID=A0A7I8VQT0_9ANNE|nr:unnamed protein product [Dimorphilus gyrociliatus]
MKPGLAEGTLIAIFALSSWINVNSLWVEVPIFIQNLPEAWSLPSYLSIIIQASNIFPFVYVLYAKRTSKSGQIPRSRLIFLVLFVTLLSCLSLIWTWQKTVANKSIALFVISFFMSGASCISQVLYLPFMANFDANFMPAFYIGEGLSGLLPSLLSLVQGVGEKSGCVNFTTPDNKTGIKPVYDRPKFSVEVFLGVETSLIGISLFSFVLLSYRLSKRKGHLQNDLSSSEQSLLEKDVEIVEDNEPKKIYFCILFVIGFFSNGLLTATQSYSSLPYGDTVYSLANRLSILINPLSCFALFFLRLPLSIIYCCLLIAGGCTTYQLVLAFYSPNPPITGIIGSILVVSDRYK